MKIGVIGLKGKWSSEKLVEEIQNLGHASMVIEMEDVCFDLSTRSVTAGSQDLTTFDGFIIKKLGKEYTPYLYDRLEVLDFLHKEKKIPFFSSPDKIRRLINRYTCTNELSMGGVAMPATVVTESVSAAMGKLEEWGEVIVKPLFTSKSRGMEMIKFDKDAEKKLKKFHKEFNTIYMQKLVKHPGYDLGVCFLGTEYIGTYARVGNSEGWNTTTRTGGHYEKKTPGEDIIAIAKKARDIYDLDFTCVDVVETPDGPMVFEVSAFGGYKGLQESAGMNLAADYAKYVIKRIENAN